MERLSLETQTLYAELMERLAALEVHRTIAHLPGSFASKEVKGKKSWVKRVKAGL